MKIKSVLLVGLAGFALASCGGAKGYKNNVKHTVFLEEFEKIAEQSVILNPDKVYSYVLTAKDESLDIDTYIKNEKKLCENIIESHSEQKIEFDSVNSLLHVVSKGEEKYSDPSEEKVDTVNYDAQYQWDLKNLYVVDKNAKLYTKSAASLAKESIDTLAKGYITSKLASFAGKAYDSDLNFFIDKNVYTIEEKITEEDSSKTKNVKSIYQFTLLDNGYDYYSETTIEIKELNLTTVDKTSTSVSLRKKDVTIKSIDLGKYLEHIDF